jgi:hypothetical protein
VRRAVTIVEVLMGAALAALLMGMIYGAFHVFFSDKSRHSVTTLTKKSFVQKDAKAGLRRLIYRLRESIEVLEPEPGRGGTQLVFRDIMNRRVRVRRDGTQNRMLSERFDGSNWVEEKAPETLTVGSTTLPATWPVWMPNCTDVYFTVLSPECVAVEASLISDGQPGSMTTVIKLRNAAVAR